MEADERAEEIERLEEIASIKQLLDNLIEAMEENHGDPVAIVSCKGASRFLDVVLVKLNPPKHWEDIKQH